MRAKVVSFAMRSSGGLMSMGSQVVVFGGAVVWTLGHFVLLDVS